MEEIIKNRIKELLEERFDEDCIEELERESFEGMFEYLDEVIWEEFGKDLENSEELEDLFYDMKEEKLKEKWDSREE